MVNVTVFGATGYVGIEIVRLLLKHPYANITAVASQSHTGMNISDMYPNLRGIFDMECSAPDAEKLATLSDVCITCLPHGISSGIIPVMHAKGVKVIDHSADFRFRSVAVYEKWYATAHKMPQLVPEAVYGLPELYRDRIRSAAIVSNPGCYPTCSILGIAPLIAGRLAETGSIIIDAASGVSGAGRNTELPYQFCECTENYKAYKPVIHRHTPEIEQELSLIAGEDIAVTFTPHLVPIKRGMMCTIYCNLKENATAAELISLYRKHYSGEFFIRILDEGTLPETKNVTGSNFIDIGMAIDKRMNRVIIFSCLDNLGKGAAGQAVQDFNIMCGFPEKTGLDSPGSYL
jgi:N-acetyl-gamma-glutamyl-phosphate reductase